MHARDEIAGYWDDYAHAYDAEPGSGLGGPGRPGHARGLACVASAVVAGAAERRRGSRVRHRLADGARRRTRALRRRDRPRRQHGGAGESQERGSSQLVSIKQGDVSRPPIEPASVDVILARHILWTLPDPQAVLARWRSLLRPGGRFLLVEGRWWSMGDEDHDDEALMPWAGGVRAADLAAAHEPLVQRVEVPLTDPVLWGKEIADECYLLVADVSQKATPAV